MKIPTIFIPEREISLERLLRKPRLHDYDHDYDEDNVQALLENCDKFMLDLKGPHKLDEIYETGKSLAEKTSFTARDINELSKRITIKCDSERYLGFYLSALVNKIIKEFDMIDLEPREELFGLGAYLPTGKLLVRGNMKYFAGAFMSGGVCIIDGNSGNRSGNGMAGGKLIIYRDAGRDTGNFMEGGIIRVDESIESISSNCKGKIYNGRSEQLWPK